MSGPLLVLDRVGFTYDTPRGPFVALEHVSISVTVGELVCIVGPSGCGKSTLLRLIAGLIEPTAGAVHLDGQAIHGPGADRGIVFQQPALYPWLTVQENVGLGLRLRGMPRAERTLKVDRMLDLVGLAGFGDRSPWELSGGMQQRAAIARVLVNEPRMVLMDEPFGALDALTREHMQEELLSLWRATGTTIALITHHVEEAVYLGTRTLVMSPRPGRILADIPTPFSRDPRDSRTVKSQPDFVAMRESVLAHIWHTTTPSDRA
jgi:taurine transport system ATP-binding protein